MCCIWQLFVGKAEPLNERWTFAYGCAKIFGSGNQNLEKWKKLPKDLTSLVEGEFPLTTGKLRLWRTSWLPRCAEGCRFGKKKAFHWSAEDGLAFFWADKNLQWHLSYISKAGFALDTHAGANTIGTLWAQMHERLREWLVLAESEKFSWDKLLRHLGGTSNPD